MQGGSPGWLAELQSGLAALWTKCGRKVTLCPLQLCFKLAGWLAGWLSWLAGWLAGVLGGSLLAGWLHFKNATKMRPGYAFLHRLQRLRAAQPMGY